MERKVAGNRLGHAQWIGMYMHEVECDLHAL